MRQRDRAWRRVGLGIIALAGAIDAGRWPGDGGASGVLAFLIALAGAVLLVQGRRAPLALRIERSRHRDLPQAIHRRVQRRDGGGG